MEDNERSKYDILGVPLSSTQEEIRRAYRQRALECHPDKTHDTRTIVEFLRVKDAYETLVDPDLRHKYDEEIRNSQRDHTHSDAKFPDIQELLMCLLSSSKTKNAIMTTFESVVAHIKRDRLSERIECRLSLKDFHLGTSISVSLPDYGEKCTHCNGLGLTGWDASPTVDTPTPAVLPEICESCRGSGIHADTTKVHIVTVEPGCTHGHEVVISNGVGAKKHVLGMSGDLIVTFLDKEVRKSERDTYFCRSGRETHDMLLYVPFPPGQYTRAIFHIDGRTILNVQLVGVCGGEYVVRGGGLSKKTVDGVVVCGDLIVRTKVILPPFMVHQTPLFFY